jgi:hypothetical protein
MAQKLIVGPINKGLRTDRLPFAIDNDSFPVLKNAYQWRGRVKRKRGTTQLGQLQRYLGTTNGAGNLTVTIPSAPVSGQSFFTVGTNIFTDPGTGFPVTLLTTGPGTATLTVGGVLTITGSNPATPVIYFPQLPVMGIEELNLNDTLTPGTLAFDTTYSYNVSSTFPWPINDVSFYKNPLASVSLPGYVPKTTSTPLTWNGQDYQQFWTVNYEGALWATNGVQIPFLNNNIGMQYASSSTTPPLSSATWVNATTMQFTIVGNPLVIGDFVFANEFTGLGAAGLNFQSGYVTAQGNTFTVVFPNATIADAIYAPGMLQYLTNRSFPSQDCLRWFDGDPTNGQVPPVFSSGDGWVNYCPPLSEFAFSISDLPQAQYYLIGARMIIPFKDRLLFLGAVVQTSSFGSQVYLQDTIVYTENGTPYYTTSYTNTPDATKDTPTHVGNVFNPILLPANQSSISPAVFADQVGFGGDLSAGVSDAIVSAGFNEDALIVGFTKRQTRVIATGNDVSPFEFFIVNSDLGTSSTFSTITMDEAVLSRGSRGFVMASQTATERFDVEILDQVFQINLNNNGNERFTAIRDFINEWVYFTYNSNQSIWRYPNETLFYNYRDQSFGLFYESYTTYGPFVESSGETWADLTYLTWETWNSPWNSGDSTLNQPIVLAGNQQGYLLIRETYSTDEAPSLSIQNFAGGVITSPNHNLNNGDYITITGAQGTNVNLINGIVFTVQNAGVNSFTLAPNPGAVIYTGGGTIIRMYLPFIQTKQFPEAWNIGRKTRIGPQMYLLTKTEAGQITVEIYLSQDDSTVFNAGPIPPQPNPTNDALIFSQTVFTCPESTNLGLTPFNTNLNMLIEPGPTAGSPASSGSNQIWHRMNTSMIGDTVQLAFTLSQAQMTDPLLIQQFSEIELHGFTLDVSSASYLT